MCQSYTKQKSVQFEKVTVSIQCNRYNWFVVYLILGLLYEDESEEIHSFWLCNQKDQSIINESPRYSGVLAAVRFNAITVNMKARLCGDLISEMKSGLIFVSKIFAEISETYWIAQMETDQLVNKKSFNGSKYLVAFQTMNLYIACDFFVWKTFFSFCVRYNSSGNPP